MRSAFQAILYTNVFIAGCAVALCVATDALIDGRVQPLPLYLLVGGGTLVAYNIHALVNHALCGPGHLPKQVRSLQIICLGAGAVLATASLPFLRFEVMVATAALGLAAMLYSTPLLPFRYKQRLKDFGLLKVAVLTGVWVLVTTLLPGLASGLSARAVVEILWPEALVRTLFILPLCLAFDIRDVGPDRAAGIFTVPVSIGISLTYRLAYFLLVACVVVAYFFHGMHWYWWAALVAVLYAGWSVAYTKKTGGAVSYLFFVDGAMGVYALLQILPAFFPQLHF